MTGMQLQRWREGERSVLRPSGIFDGAAFRDLRESLRRESAPEVVIDLGLVRLDELWLLSLARLLEESPGQRVALRGLSQHHLRIFRYIGVPISARAAKGEP